MEEIIKTTLLEFEKSTFLIDLIRHKTGASYVSIQQTVHFEKNKIESHTVKINPSILNDIVKVLKNYDDEILKVKQNSKDYFSVDKKKEIIARYFKGLEIEDLAFQFGCSKNIIEQILTNADIEIVSNKIPKEEKVRKKRRK